MKFKPLLIRKEQYTSKRPVRNPSFQYPNPKIPKGGAFSTKTGFQFYKVKLVRKNHPIGDRSYNSRLGNKFISLGLALGTLEIF
ncbi:hypothetical protein [Cyclobacterium jeungdonense]|uniref:Uncharacterized protein n=1 Tax=Cyclobacterium jeungdonense TaxID=708087 RepID=A0ABT8C0Z4_9BACT|nr:hypothetical protein [Cyclobacterium jeungdonense]MDN3686464.1 hypothetical protein [Cyclobacterium jeungdonense]